MNSLASSFYRIRDQRTEEYLPSGLDYEVPIHVAIDDGASRTRGGQVLVLSLVNQVARAFRRITIGVPRDVPNLLSVVSAGETLDHAVLGLASAIDPHGEFSVGAPQSSAWVRIGVGQPETSCQWYLGADRSLAFLDRKPVPLRDEHPGTIRGACLASCLGAATVFREVLGQKPCSRTLSAWNYLDGTLAVPGPGDLVPLDVGRTLLIGAGAVASALVYWLRIMGVEGEWIVVDPDRVALHNTNRSLLFFPDHAGWPDGQSQLKAQVLAEALPGGKALARWYDECDAVELGSPDLVLPLANARGVRARVGSRNHVVVLHATTGRRWFSELHRHAAGRDDCISCRLPEESGPPFECSKGEAGQGAQQEHLPDAALPFLSAASGLMLATLLQRLQSGELVREVWNDWSWHFDSERDCMARVGVRTCSRSCGVRIAPAIRQRLNSGSRWASLDAGRQSPAPLIFGRGDSLRP